MFGPCDQYPGINIHQSRVEKNSDILIGNMYPAEYVLDPTIYKMFKCQLLGEGYNDFQIKEICMILYRLVLLQIVSDKSWRKLWEIYIDLWVYRSVLQKLL